MAVATAEGSGSIQRKVERMAARLPSASAITPTRLGRVQAEPKYDGFRLQVHRDGDRVWIFSRRLEDVTAMFPDLALAVRTTASCATRDHRR